MRITASLRDTADQHATLVVSRLRRPQSTLQYDASQPTGRRRYNEPPTEPPPSAQRQRASPPSDIHAGRRSAAESVAVELERKLIASNPARLFSTARTARCEADITRSL